jgi:hypothetical protein
MEGINKQTEIDNLNDQIYKLSLKSSIFMKKDEDVLQIYRIERNLEMIIDYIDIHTDPKKIKKAYGKGVLYRKYKKTMVDDNTKDLYEKEMQRLVEKRNKLVDELELEKNDMFHSTKVKLNGILEDLFVKTKKFHDDVLIPFIEKYKKKKEERNWIQCHHIEKNGIVHYVRYNQ